MEQFPSETKDRVFTAAEIAPMLHLTYPTVIQYLKTGIIPSVKLKNRYLIKESNLRKFLREYDLESLIGAATWKTKPKKTGSSVTTHRPGPAPLTIAKWQEAITLLVPEWYNSNGFSENVVRRTVLERLRVNHPLHAVILETQIKDGQVICLDN